MRKNTPLYTLNIPSSTSQRKEYSLYIYLFSWLLISLDLLIHLLTYRCKRIGFRWHYILFSQPLIIFYILLLLVTFMPLNDIFFLSQIWTISLDRLCWLEWWCHWWLYSCFYFCFFYPLPPTFCVCFTFTFILSRL